MTDLDLIAIASSISKEANLPSFPVGKSEASLLHFFTSLSRIEKTEVIKLRSMLHKKFTKITNKEVESHYIEYISLIYAIYQSKQYINNKKKLNVRSFKGDLNSLPDFEKAKKANFKDYSKANGRKGPRKSTVETLMAHKYDILLDHSKKSPTRQISRFLKDNFNVSISHATIYRHLDLIFNDECGESHRKGDENRAP